MSDQSKQQAQTDFIWSVKNGQADDVKRFIKEGINVNESVSGRPPMHHAADGGHVDILELLVESGANVDEKDKHGMTPLLSAIFEGHKDCVEYLLSKGASKTGTAPSGQSYIECAETDEIKQLLKWKNGNIYLNCMNEEFLFPVERDIATTCSLYL